MRYNDRIAFVKNGESSYDVTTGNYIEDAPAKTIIPASVMDSRTQTMMLVYGEIRQGSLTIHIQNIYSDPFDRIEFNGKKYRVDYRRRLGTKETYIVSEVQ